MHKCILTGGDCGYEKKNKTIFSTNDGFDAGTGMGIPLQDRD